jgi:hypothetical protein
MTTNRFARTVRPSICPYCGNRLEVTPDPETGFTSPEVHWACLGEVDAATAPFIVRTTQNAADPVRVSDRGYASLTRAREMAEQIRRDNPRSWPCGRELEISVFTRMD